jgi:peptidoglycan/LPS O-acetylase OafA/YrhL
MLQELKFVGTQLPAYAGMLWTLNIEWWIYLFFGWVTVNFKRGVKMDAFFFVPLLLFAYYPIQKFLYDPTENNLPLVWFMGVAATIVYLHISKKSWDKRFDYAILAIIALIIGRTGLIYIRKTYFGDLTVETLLTLLIIMLMAKFKNTNRFDKTKTKTVIKFMAKYAFTLYLTHFVIESLIFSLYVTYGIKYSFLLVFIGAIVISNIIAIVIAYPTEMRYKKIANFLNGFMQKKLHQRKLHTIVKEIK